MEEWKQFAEKLVKLMGFLDYRVEVREDEKRGAVYIYDHPALVKEHLPTLVASVNHLVQLVAKRENRPPIFFDVNNYRQEREALITELARAAARKALLSGEDVSLPAMNSYERRLVHVALAVHPEVTTESVGSGAARYVIVKKIKE